MGMLGEGRMRLEWEGRIGMGGEGRVGLELEGRMGMEGEGRMRLEWEGRMEMEEEGRMELELEAWMGMEEEERVGLELGGRMKKEDDARVGLGWGGRMGLEWGGRIELEENEEETFPLWINVNFAFTCGGRRVREGKTGSYSPLKIFSSLTFCGYFLIFGEITWFSLTRELAKQEKLCQNEKKPVEIRYKQF